MPFVEVFTSPGSITQDQQDQISSRLVAEVTNAEGARDTAAAQAISWLVWHQLHHWSVGGTLSKDQPPG